MEQFLQPKKAAAIKGKAGRQAGIYVFSGIFHHLPLILREREDRDSMLVTIFVDCARQNCIALFVHSTFTVCFQKKRFLLRLLSDCLTANKHIMIATMRHSF